MESLGLTVSVANGGTKNNDYSATNSPRRADIMICPNRFVCKDLVSQMLVEVVLLVTCFSFQSGYGQSCYVPGAYGCCNMQYMRFGCEFFTKKKAPTWNYFLETLSYHSYFQATSNQFQFRHANT